MTCPRRLDGDRAGRVAWTGAMTAADRLGLEEELRERARRGDLAGVATRGLAAYGPELLGYMAAFAGELDVDDAFAGFAAAMWSALPRFRWDSSFRVWAHAIARRVVLASRRRARVAARRAAPTAELAAVVDRVRSATAPFLRTSVHDELSRLRAGLAEEEQALLILRIDRGMAWIEIARVFAADDEDPDEAALRRQATALRKRFERLKARLAARLRGST